MKPRFVTSADGTEIAVFEHGPSDKPTLVLVHGSTADHMRWMPVFDGLLSFVRVAAVDRRGRGASGDAAEYSIDREVEDVAAVVASVPRPVVLLGHSYGAVCSLFAMGAGLDVDALVLYEPPLALDGPISDPAVVAEMQALADAGENEALLETFMSRVVGMGEAELAVLRAAPVWPARVQAAHTIPRELAAVDAMRFDRSLVAGVTAPTTILKGTESAPYLLAACDAVHAAVPGSRLVVLEGHGHSVMDTGPDLFVDTVRSAVTSAF
jgi:pimeloyl-ACP methyl ester carboxylesterase